MRAGELAQPFPMVTPDTEALMAAQAMAEARLPGLIVCDENGRPYTVVPGSQVLRFLIPDYLQQAPGLARALDERASTNSFASWSTPPSGRSFPRRRTSTSCPWSTSMPPRWRLRR